MYFNCQLFIVSYKNMKSLFEKWTAFSFSVERIVRLKLSLCRTLLGIFVPFLRLFGLLPLPTWLFVFRFGILLIFITETSSFLSIFFLSPPRPVLLQRTTNKTIRNHLKISISVCRIFIKLIERNWTPHRIRHFIYFEKCLSKIYNRTNTSIILNIIAVRRIRSLNVI